MLKIALTGGMGSGKTFIGNIFAGLGIPVYNADTEAKKLMYTNRILKQKIKALLGKNAYYRNGRLDRTYVAKKIFGNSSLLKKINALVHPVVQQDFQEWANKQASKYVIEESALIFEINAQSNFDKVILVTADEEIRINRIIKRDKLSKKVIEKRLENQWPEERKIPLAHFVIENNGTRSLIRQVFKIHRTLIAEK